MFFSISQGTFPFTALFCIRALHLEGLQQSSTAYIWCCCDELLTTGRAGFLAIDTVFTKQVMATGYNRFREEFKANWTLYLFKKANRSVKKRESNSFVAVAW
jgi:hypothetical protein